MSETTISETTLSETTNLVPEQHHAQPERGWPLGRWLTINNPCYLLSAGLFLYGLWAVLDAELTGFDCWLLLVLLAGYIVLLAAAAVTIVRLGQVWEDARSILLILPILFFAMSLGLEQILLNEPGVGRPLLACGASFCVIVSEAVLRLLRLALPGWYRASYYATLALFFGSALALEILLSEPVRLLAQGGFFLVGAIWLEALLSGLALALLIPAINQRGKGFEENGTPWTWPWYPFPLFVILAAGLVCRTLSLAQAQDAVAGLYLVVPVAMAISGLFAIAWEIHGKPGWAVLTLVAPVSWLLLACDVPWSARPWLDQLGSWSASPLWLTAWAVALYYLVLSWRKLPGAEGLACAAILFASSLSQSALRPDELGPCAPWPLLGLGLWQLALGLQPRASLRSLRWSRSVCALILAGFYGFGLTDLLGSPGMVAAHLLVGLLFLIALSHDDDFAVFLTGTLPLLTILPPLLLWQDYCEGQATPLLGLFWSLPSKFAYLLSLSVFFGSLWRVRLQASEAGPGFLFFSYSHFTNACGWAALQLQLHADRTRWSDAGPYLLGGLGLLAIGFLASLHKAGRLGPFAASVGRWLFPASPTSKPVALDKFASENAQTTSSGELS